MTEPRLIAFHGRKRSGKDTSAELLLAHGFERIAFADPIKLIVADLDPYVDGARLSGSFGEAEEAHAMVRRLIASFGRWAGVTDLTAEQSARALDTLDPMVTGTQRAADLLAEAGGDWNLVKDETDPRHREVRRLQQILGTEVGRELIGDSVWTDAAMRLVDRFAARGASSVITDCRFDNEAERVRDAGGTVVRVIRPSLPAPTDAHASEAGIHDDLVDIEIVNDGTIADLHAKVGRALGLA